MILFQWIAFGILGCLLINEVARGLRGNTRRSTALLRSSLWLIAILCIAWPDVTTHIAMALGVARGANLILYVFCLAFLASTLYFYSRQLKLESKLTEIVRHLAIQEARLGEDRRAETQE